MRNLCCDGEVSCNSDCAAKLRGLLYDANNKLAFLFKIIDIANNLYNHGPVSVVTDDRSMEPAYAIAKPGMDMLFDALDELKKRGNNAR